MCPKTVEEWVTLGKSLAACQNYAEAVKAFENALGLDPRRVAVWKLLARSYNDAGATADAVDVLHKALKFAPDDAELWNNLGVALDDLGEVTGAMEAYEKSLTLDPKDAVAWYNAGLVFEEINLLGNALYCFERAHRLGDEDGEEKVSELRDRGIQPVAPAFAERKELDQKSSSDDNAGPVCEKCGATLPQNPARGREVTCPGCGWVWRTSDFQK